MGSNLREERDEQYVGHGKNRALDKPTPFYTTLNEKSCLKAELWHYNSLPVSLVGSCAGGRHAIERMSRVKQLDILLCFDGSSIHDSTTTTDIGRFDSVGESEVGGWGRGPTQVFDFNVDDLTAEEVEVEIVAIITEGLFDFFTRCDETEVEERGNGHSWNRDI
jgi:dienelactone hydrolase